jgi:hypothetical protein
LQVDGTSAAIAQHITRNQPEHTMPTMRTAPEDNASALATAFAVDQIAACLRWSAMEWRTRVADEEHAREAAALRARDILARGGKITVEAVRTPRCTVLMLDEREADGTPGLAQNVGEIWA